MTSLMLWDEAIEASEDSAQIRRDMKNHPRTSFKSMLELVRVVDSQGGLGDYDDRRYVKARMSEMQEWLINNRDKLPMEIEDEHGNRNSDQRLERLVGEYDQIADDTAEVDPDNGLYDVGQSWRNAYRSLDTLVAPSSEDGKLLAEFGLVPAVFCYLMDIRGEHFSKYYAQRAKWLRWRGMRWAVAYDNTVAILDRVGRTKMSVLDLPDNLSDLLSLDGDTLRWKVARGRAAVGSVADGKQIRIEGRLYSRSRIVQYLREGWVSDYRKVKGTKTEREDGNWDVRLKLGQKSHTVMECHTEAEADAALWSIRWAVVNYQ
jgi:hypothetical protein